MNEEYSVSERSLDIFGFKRRSCGDWYLLNWENFLIVPGVIRSEFILHEDKSFWIFEAHVEENEKMITHSFKIFNLAGVLYCISLFIDEKCWCSDFDRTLIENFYLDKLYQISKQN